MKRLRLLTNAFLIAVGIIASPALAVSSWTLFGLKGETVNTIITLSPGNGEDALMVGTSKGIWNHEYGHWVSVWQGLPVLDMRLIANNMILAAAGNGSDSDGIYLGKVVAIGEPGNLWRFKRIVKINQPAAVECRVLLSTARENCFGTIFAGNGAGVSGGTLCGDSVEAFSPMSGPANPWGQCASLLVSSDYTLWAGGNFSNVLTNVYTLAPLLRGQNALTEFKKLNVTSMVEYASRGDTILAVATIDSGIQFFKKEARAGYRPSPVGGEPVVSVVPFAAQNFGSQAWTMLAAATPSGVYRECPPNADCIWTDFGARIPAKPRCLAQYQGKVLWAGTDSGVYRYEYTTATFGRNHPTAVLPLHLQTIRSNNGVVVFRFSGGNTADYTLHIFDVQGKCIGKGVVAGESVIVSGVGSGTFVWRAYRDGRDVDGDKFVSQ